MTIDVRGGIDDEGNIVAWDYEVGRRPTTPARRRSRYRRCWPAQFDGASRRREVRDRLWRRRPQCPARTTPSRTTASPCTGSGRRFAPRRSQSRRARQRHRQRDLLRRARRGGRRRPGRVPPAPPLRSAGHRRHPAGRRGLGWETRPSGPGRAPTTATQARCRQGIAFARYETEFAYAAVVAEVEVDPARQRESRASSSATTAG